MDRIRRTERLIQIWLLLLHNPLRFTARDLADRLNVNVRTVYRDLGALQSNLRVPVWEDGNKWAIQESYFLPPIRFTVSEAINIFLAARLMLAYSHRYDPNVDSTFTKLGAALPGPLREQVNQTLEWMQKLPKNERYLSTLAKLAEAWTGRRTVKISYRALEKEIATDRLVAPYFIEPAVAGHSSYLIAHCHQSGEVRTFKLERIESIEMADRSYEMPDDFNANHYFSSSWGVVVGGEKKTVRLRFHRTVARIIEETVWHPSQVLHKEKDGSVTVTFQVLDTVELHSWILGWGDKVEVLDPEEVRNSIMQTAQGVLSVYGRAKRK